MSAVCTSTDAAQAEAVRWQCSLGSRGHLVVDFARVCAQAAFKGVVPERGRFRAQARIGGGKIVRLEKFCATAEDAAHAFDDAVRKAGGRVVNFPRAGTNEVQAVKGEKDSATLRNAGEGLPRRSGPLPTLVKRFKGVSINPTATTAAVYAAEIRVDGKHAHLGNFCTEEEAARAFDDAMRKAGRRVVNFPRPGTNEVQAVKGEDELITLRNAGEGPPRHSGPLPTLKKHFKGVTVHPTATTAAVYAAEICVDKMRTHLGGFCTEEEAARAYDDGMRKAGRLVVNFPRAGTNEVQAVQGEKEDVTLRRHAAQQSAPDAGAAASPRVIASPPPKRSAASAVPTKHAAAHRFGSTGVSAAASPPLQPKREVDAAAVPAGIAAPAHQPARRAASKRGAAESPAPLSRPLRNEAAGAPPPAKKQRLDERSPAGIKLETPSSVKLETPSPVKFETPAAVKLEVPALPARPPRSASVDEPAAASPAKKQRSEKPAPANIKLERPTAVKPETPAAPALPAVSVFGASSPSAAPVKTEDEAAVAAFLRSFSPPLSDLNAALQASAGGAISMAQLRRVATLLQPERYQSAVTALAARLRLRNAGDELSLMLALQKLKQRGACL